MKLKFYGSSDDLFIVDSDPKGICEEIGCYERMAAYRLRDAADESGNTGLFVTGRYADDSYREGVWTVGIAPLDEDVPLPDWAITVRAEKYTAVVELVVPDTVVVEYLQAKEIVRDDDGNPELVWGQA